MDWLLLALRIITIIILYTFLGIAFYLIWRSLKQAETAAMAPKPEPKLRVISAVDEPALTEGVTIPLRQETLLGHALDNTFAISDVSISNSHARIFRTLGKWWLENLGNNGTLLNELPVTKTVSLADGDIISVGSVRLKLELTELQGRAEQGKVRSEE